MARPWSEIAEKAASERVERNHPETTAEAHASGVREGIELVEQQAKQVYRTGPEDMEAEVAVGWIEWACSIARDDALAAFKAEASGGAE